MLQTSTSFSENQAEAIIASSNLSAIFVGGHISQSPWLLAGETGGAAHVGRVDLDRKVWQWSQVFTVVGSQKLTTITALAIDP